MVSLKVALLVCCAVWVSEATAATADEEKDKHTPVAVAVALAEESGTVEEGQRDKRFFPLFPPYPYSSYYRDITPEEWEAARRWMERRYREDPTFLDAAGSQTSGVVDRQYSRGFPPPPPWYYGDYHPYYAYLRWFRGPHAHSDWDHADGFCPYPYPHTHPLRPFSRGQKGQEGVRGSEGGQRYGGSDRDGLVGFDRNQQGFDKDRNFQVTASGQGQQGPGRDRGSQGFNEDRDTGFSGSDRDPGRFPGSGGQGFSNQQDFVRGQQGFSGSRDQTPSFGSFPQIDRPSQSGQFGADNFPLSGQDRPFDGSRPGSGPTRGGGEGFSMGSGNVPFTSGGSNTFDAGSSLLNVGGSNTAGVGGSDSPSPFNIGGTNNFGAGGSFNANIPSAFGTGSPTGSGTQSSFTPGGTGASNVNRVTLSSSVTSSGDPLSSFPGSSALDTSGNLQGPGSASDRFPGFGSNVRNRNQQRDVSDAKNAIKRETDAGADESPAVESSPSSTN